MLTQIGSPINGPEEKVQQLCGAQRNTNVPSLAEAGLSLPKGATCAIHHTFLIESMHGVKFGCNTAWSPCVKEMSTDKNAGL